MELKLEEQITHFYYVAQSEAFVILSSTIVILSEAKDLSSRVRSFASLRMTMVKLKGYAKGF